MTAPNLFQNALSRHFSYLSSTQSHWLSAKRWNPSTVELAGNTLSETERLGEVCYNLNSQNCQAAWRAQRGCNFKQMARHIILYKG
ncbi:hypothetical protein CEXT_187531 [Caerostris extrusa]|uniref:Uncharacterized protein n=1 Tax=Caerostris extrusa TaxID=172846 RepID=A0AAV4WWW5_CAEEX|nr:hypothetical protein CEXT_187531 [Caerostris extrusa]